MSLHDLTLEELSSALARREVTSRAATEHALARVKALDGKLHAFLLVDDAGALRAADESDARAAAGQRRGPLDGVPLALKDIFCTRGVATTCASRILQGYVPPFDATPVQRLRDAGAVLLGKLNMDEFAMGSSGENSAFGPAHNPWDLERTPGGSSSGSAAAVAGRLCWGALGTDTGGSIREPAAFSGVVGFKPTYGRVSRYGVVAFASSLDQVGPFGRTVRDAALQLGAIAGHDPLDQTSSELDVPDYLAGIERGAEGLTIGVPREYFVSGMDAEVESSVRAAIEKMRAAGATVRELSLPHTRYALATYYLIAPSEAASNLARYDGVRYGPRDRSAGALLDLYRKTRRAGFGDEVKRRIMLGTYALSAGYSEAYYGKAQRVRTLIRQDFERAFAEVDVLFTPTSPAPAFRLGEKTADPLQMYLADVFTLSCNLAGLPGLSMPCGFTRAGLPIGLQILGRPFDEPGVLRAARAAEKAIGLEPRSPAP